MTMQTILVCLMINTLCVLIYGIRGHILHNTGSTIRSCVMLLCPFVGMIYFGSGYLLSHYVYKREPDLEDVYVGRSKFKLTEAAQESSEVNIIPLEESLVVNNEQDTREVIFNMMQRDYDNMLSSISKALQSENSEISHYAASILQEEIDTFRAKTQSWHATIKEHPDKYAMEQMIDYIYQVLSQHILSHLEHVDMVHMLDEIAEMRFRESEHDMTAIHMKETALQCIETEEYVLADKWCKRLEKNFTNTLARYCCRLNYYYNLHDAQNFRRTMDDLKKSNITIDAETLSLIRTFG